MSGIDQLILMCIEAFILSIFLYMLTRLKPWLGTSPLLVTLGSLQFVQVILAMSLYIEVFPGLLISPGSSVFFVGTILGVLLIYIIDDAKGARKLIYSLLIANVFLSLATISISTHYLGEYIHLFVDLPREVFLQHPRVMIVGTFALFIDTILVIIIYDLLVKIKFLFLRILFTLSIVLIFDSLIFITGVFIENENYFNMLTSSIIGKLLTVPAFALGIIIIEKLMRRHKINETKTVKDFFYLLTYREKFDKVSKELSDNSKMFQKLTENIPAMLYQYKRNPDGTSYFPYISKGIKDVYELSPLDLKDSDVSLFEKLHEDDLELVISSIEKSAERLEDWNLEYRVNLPKKGLRWLHGHSKPEKLEDGSILWHGSINDITDRVEYREKLKSQAVLLEARKKELENIIQGNPHPMILHNEDGEILMLNQAWTNSSGYYIEDIPTINDLINSAYDDEESRINLKKHIDLIYEITETKEEGEFVIFNKNKDLLTWQMSSSPLGLIDGKRTIITSGVDLTVMKEKEQILFQQSKMAAMGKMLGNIAHQWRQPLSTISTASTGAKLQKEMDCLSDEQLTSALTSINDSAQYLSQTIDDFRGFFNPSNNKLTKFNISHTFKKTLNLIKAQFIAKNIEIIHNTEDFELLSKENELIQVLINLLNNARDALLVSQEERKLIFINTYQKENTSYIEIIDNAGGIKKDIIDRIFEPYFTTKHKSKGTGIGLYMSEEIVKNHLKGNLTVSNSTYTYEDTKYIGAKFTIEISID